MKLISRMPSHLTSNSQRSLSNGSATSCAFIGSRLLGIGPFSAVARLISPPSPSARLLDQTASFPCSISSLVRPVLTEVVKVSMLKFGSAHSSFFLIRSQSFSDRVRTRAYRPQRRTPLRRNLTSPRRSDSAGVDSSSSKVPQSQIITVPPPYSPLGMVPS